MVAFNPQTAVKVISVLSPVARTATAASRGVDTIGYTHALVILDAGVVGDTVTATVQTSSSVDTGYANLTGAAFTAVTGANDEKVYAGVVYTATQARYLRVNAAFAGSTSAAADANVLSYAFSV